MSLPIRSGYVCVAVGSLVGVMALLAPTASAATDPGAALGARSTASAPSPAAGGHGPGKADTDGNRIADDLEAALRAATPGDRVSVIVQGVTPDRAAAVATSLRVTQRYRLLPAFAGDLLAGQVTALSHLPGVTRVELNGVTTASDAAGDRDYGVEAARAAGPTLAPDGTLDGTGVGICVIDTGIDPNHEQLVGRVIGWRDWTNPATTTAYDDHGHGTHVSGIAAGNGLGTHAAYGGVARAARLVGAKVLTAAGTGEDADVVSAIEWCAARPDVRIISMSLGSGPSDGLDAGSQAVNAAVVILGKVVVAAAGNDGDAPGTVSSPGVATGSITVGAATDYSAPVGDPGHDRGLVLAGFSSRGPTANLSAPLKPDIVAPGVTVMSAQAGTTTGYVGYSGTSMATPFVSGVVALGLEAVPSATPAQVKAALQASARDAGPAGADNDWGYGLVDARAFIDRLRGTTPLTSAVWPGQARYTGSVATNGVASIAIPVIAAGAPLGISVRTDGRLICVLDFFGLCLAYGWSPDLDISLIDPSGATVATSSCPLEATNGNCGAAGQWETVGVDSAAAGTWTLRIVPFAGEPNYGAGGGYAVDVFGALAAAPPPAPPTAPSNLSGQALSKSQIKLTWTDNSANETSFVIERCRGAGCTAFATVATVGADVTTYTNTGLKAGTTYVYRVRSANSFGNSTPSNSVTLTTPRR